VQLQKRIAEIEFLIQMRLPPPDFVVVGAPKCGTTAIYATLRLHPQLFLSECKEPHFFAFDYPGRRDVRTIEDYDSLFAGSGADQLRGEASVFYLSSKAAIAAILERRPDAKFIAVVRNPVDMFVSMHNQNLNQSEEEELDPERAWDLQEQRAQGRRIPKRCRGPICLQYKTLCSLGRQIESLSLLVPDEQRLFIVFDDLQYVPRAVYRGIVNFLGVEDEGRSCFARENVFFRPRSTLLAEMIRFALLNPGVNKLGVRLKPALHRRGIRPLTWLALHNVKYVAKPTLSREFRRTLEAAFAPDVKLLGRLLHRDLGEQWSIGDNTPAQGADQPSAPGLRASGTRRSASGALRNR
jgi:hypothetical protein